MNANLKNSMTMSEAEAEISGRRGIDCRVIILSLAKISED
jgi:hypothetical protein